MKRKAIIAANYNYLKCQNYYRLLKEKLWKPPNFEVPAIIKSYEVPVKGYDSWTNLVIQLYNIPMWIKDHGNSQTQNAQAHMHIYIEIEIILKKHIKLQDVLPCRHVKNYCLQELKGKGGQTL